MIAFDSASLTVDYQALNPGGLTAPCFLIRILNFSSNDIIISYDGVHDNDIIIADATLQLEFQTNSGLGSKAAYLAKGTVIYAKGEESSGDIYVIGYYQPQGA